MRRFFAPGKLVLLGEYAVVDGGPALVAAIHRGVNCTVLIDDSAPQTRIIETPGDASFVTAVLQSVAAPIGRYTFSDAEPVAGIQGKPGFGGSAAATVAAVFAAWTLSGIPFTPHELFLKSQAIHHQIQGSGSGVDVAAAAHGGVIRFAGGQVHPQSPVRPVVVWSGQSASTGPRVQQYLSWNGRDEFVRRSRELVDTFSKDPIATLREGRRLLEKMATDAGIDYRTPALDRIAALAESHGGAAKPSGAGGGDCAVALFPDPDTERAFLKACGSEGLISIPVKVAGGARERSLADTVPPAPRRG